MEDDVSPKHRLWTADHVDDHDYDIRHRLWYKMWAVPGRQMLYIKTKDW